MQRRDFIKLGSLSAIPLLAPRLVFGATGGGARDVLVCLFLRGGADGLGLVAPYGDARYRALRPTLGLPEPGVEGGLIDIDGYFGLHPGLAPLVPMLTSGELAIVHAAGSPSDSRSHFDAQDFMETGTAEKGNAFDGWLNRHLASQSGDELDVFSAVGLGARLPLSLQGDVPALGLVDLSTFDLAVPASTATSMQQALSTLYAQPDSLGAQGRAVFEAIDALEESGVADTEPANGAQYPAGGLGTQLAAVAALVRSDLGLEVACVDYGGWDHHDQEAAQLDLNSTELAEALAAFHTDLGADMGRVTLVAMTEFGRRAQENASAGTDHGHGSIMLALGGNVNGGQVLGDWPGIRDSDLYRGDLAVTTDYRTVLAEALIKRRGQNDVAGVFPNFDGPMDTGLFTG